MPNVMYTISGHIVDVIAHRDAATPDGQVEWYEFWLAANDKGDLVRRLTLIGDEWYPDTVTYDPPTREMVETYLVNHRSDLFPTFETPQEKERTYEIVLRCTVDEDDKKDMGRSDFTDEEFIVAELSFSGLAMDIEQVSFTKVPPTEDAKTILVAT